MCQTLEKLSKERRQRSRIKEKSHNRMRLKSKLDKVAVVLHNDQECWNDSLTLYNSTVSVVPHRPRTCCRTSFSSETVV